MNPPIQGRSLRELDREDNRSATNATVAIYHSHAEAEAAVKELQRAGFDMKKLSIIGRDYHTDEHVVGYYNAGDRMKYWGKNGAFWGGIWGMLFGSAFFLIPGVGPLLVAGPLVAWIVGALEGAAVLGGLSVIGAGLFSLGIPKNSIVQYETALKTGKFVLIAHGSAKEAAHARDIISRTPAHRGMIRGHEVDESDRSPAFSHRDETVDTRRRCHRPESNHDHIAPSRHDAHQSGATRDYANIKPPSKMAFNGIDTNEEHMLERQAASRRERGRQDYSSLAPGRRNTSAVSSRFIETRSMLVSGSRFRARAICSATWVMVVVA